MLNVQNFLRYESLEQLNSQFGIKPKRHQQYPNLISLNYDQINSPKTHLIVRECRGLILDEAENWQVVAYPYRRFFNSGEDSADPIDWDSAQCYDKCDGSLCILYFYQGQWHVATRGTPDASGQVNRFGFSFKELFWQTWKELSYHLPQATDCCYMFELMTSHNRVVVQHHKNQLLLHGVREVLFYQEFNPVEVANVYGWQSVSTYPLQTLDEILAAAKLLEPMQSEGYIVCDRHFNRVKVKAPAYVAAAHFKEGFSSRRLLEILIANESDEFLIYFPEWSDLYYQIKRQLDSLAQDVEAVYQTHQELKSQKDFALAVKDHPLSGILFQRRANKIASITEGIYNLNVQKLEQILEIEYFPLGNQG